MLLFFVGFFFLPYCHNDVNIRGGSACTLLDSHKNVNLNLLRWYPYPQHFVFNENIFAATVHDFFLNRKVLNEVIISVCACVRACARARACVCVCVCVCFCSVKSGCTSTEEYKAFL